MTSLGDPAVGGPAADPWDEAGVRLVPGSVGDLLRAVAAVQASDPARSWAWRGQGDSGWALTSSLFRRLRCFGPEEVVPTEKQMRAYEHDLVAKAIATGRLTATSHLQLLAELQHHGAATRLLDVTRDPIPALWFASEATQQAAVDGAVFAL